MKKKVITKEEWLEYIEAVKAWVELWYPDVVALDDSGSNPPPPPPPPPGNH